MWIGCTASFISILSTLLSISLCDKLNLTSIVINGSLSCGDTISGYLNKLPYEQTFYSFSLSSTTNKTNIKLTTCDPSGYVYNSAITYLYIYNSSGYRIDYPRTFPDECITNSVSQTLDQELVADESYIFAIARGPRSSKNFYTLNVYCSEPIIPPIISNQTGDYYIASSYSSKVFALPWKTIYCLSQKHCYVVCDIEYGCRATTVNASNTNNLTVICSQSDSCNNIRIIGAALESNLVCNGDKTCNLAQYIEMPLMSNFNLQCYGMEACFHLDMDLNHVTSLNIICDGLRACRSMDILSNDVDTFNMECRSTDSCFYTYIGIKNVSHTSYKCFSLSCRHGTQVKIVNGIDTTIECVGVHSCDSAIFNVSNNDNVSLIADGSYSTYNSILYAFKIDNLYIKCKTQSCFEFDIYVSLEDEKIYTDNDIFIQIDCIDPASCDDTLTIWSNDDSVNNILFNCSYCWQTSIYCVQTPILTDSGINCNDYPLDASCYGNATELLCDHAATENEWSCSDDSCCPKVIGYCPPTSAPTSTPTAAPTVSPIPTTARPTRDYDDDEGGFGAGAGGGIGGFCGLCLLCLCVYFFCKGGGCGSGSDDDGAVAKVTETTYWSDGTKTKKTSYKY